MFRFSNEMNERKKKIQNDTCFRFWFQPVGFVTFHTRAGAEAAKQDLQVIPRFTTHRHRERKRCSIRNARELPRAPLPSIFFLSVRLYTIYIYNIYIYPHIKYKETARNFLSPLPFFLSFFFSLSLSLFLSPLFLSLFLEINMKIHTLALDSSWHGLMLLPL